MKKLLYLFFLLFSTPFIQAQTCDFIRDHHGQVNETVVGCNFSFDNSCIRLNANFPNLLSSTTYQVEKVAYNPIGSFTDGTPIQANADDQYVRRINFNSLGDEAFLFTYFGDLKESAIISSNGFISFNSNFNVGDYSNPLLDNQSIPNQFLPSSSIFGIFQDLNFSNSNDSEIYTQVLGEYPCRKLIINYYNARFTGNNQTTTFQIVLHELNSKIEIHVQNKPIPEQGVRFRSSLIGIVNQFGSGFAAPNRNTGIWSATNESYVFTPSGQSISPRQINWTNTINSSQTSSNSINVCTLSPATYTATAIYEMNGTRFNVKDKHQIRFEPNYPLAKNHSEVICNSNEPLTQSRFYPNLNAQTNHSLFRYKFYINRNDANNNNSNFLSPTQILQSNQTYFVRIENASNPNCYAIATLELKSTVTFPAFVEICDTYNDRQEDYILNNLNCSLFQNVPNATNIRYFINNQTTPSTRAVLNQNTTIKVQYNLPGCTDLMSSEINIRFINSPQLISNEMNFNSDEEIFDIVTNNNPINREPYIWSEELENAGIVLTSDENTSIKAFLTLEDALNNTNAINYILEGNPNLDYRYTMYFRVENESKDCKGFCGNIVTVNARIKFKKIILNIDDADTDTPIDNPLIYDEETADIYLCGNENYNRNLLDDMQSIFRVTNHDLSDLRVTFHVNYNTANNLANEGINPNITINANSTYLVRLELPYTGTQDPPKQQFVVKPLNYILLPNIPMESSINICVDYTISEQNITLNDYIPRIINERYLNLEPRPIITFYNDENATNEITTLQITSDVQRVWVKIKYTQTENVCEQISPIDFKLVSIEGVIKATHQVDLTCDNNNDNQEIINLNDYIESYVETPTNYSVEFYRNYNASTNSFSNRIQTPSNFVVNGNTTVYIKLNQNNIEATCSQKLELQLNYNIATEHTIKLKPQANLLLCNEANTPYVYFDLERSISQSYLDTNPPMESFITTIRFYENYDDANAGNSNYIQEINRYGVELDRPRVIIYARYENQYGCYSISQVQLEIIGLIKLKTDLKIDLCDTNFDEKYQFNLRQWVINATTDEDTSNDLLIDENTNRLATYQFYLNMDDYTNGRALTLSEEQNFIFDPSVHQNIILGATLEGGCIDRIPVQINYQSFETYNYQYPELCDENNDGIETIDLTIFELNHPNAQFTYYNDLNDLNLNINPIQNPTQFEFSQTSSQTIYFIIDQEGLSCANLGSIIIRLKPSPIVELNDYKICPGESITITPAIAQWEIEEMQWFNWNNELISTQSSLTIEQPGIYRLRLKATNGCTSIEEFEISHYDLPVIEEIIFQESSATVIASGNRNILFSMNGIDWQQNNTFTDLANGLHQFYIKYENENCIVGPIEGIIPIIHNTISPNGDGINDQWIIRNLHVFNGQMAKLEIFDRYGKRLFQQESNTQFEWNGKLDGKPIPSTSYWYIIILPDGRKYTGYINVLNKN